MFLSSYFLIYLLSLHFLLLRSIINFFFISVIQNVGNPHLNTGSSIN